MTALPALPVPGDDPGRQFLDDLNSRLEALKKEGAHILTPFMIQAIPAKHLPVLIPVWISPDPQQGEVYKQGGDDSGKLALSRIAWQKLEQAMGIEWDARECRRVDSGANMDYVHYRSVGRYKTVDGSYKELFGEKEIRVDVVREEYLDSYRKRAERWLKSRDEKDQWFRKKFPTPEAQEGYIQDKVRQDLLQLRKHLLARAITGSKSNATKGLGIKEVYTAQELRHPFVVLKLQARLDPNDPQDAALIRLQALGFTDALYRSGNLTLPAPVDPMPAQAQIPSFHVPESPAEAMASFRDVTPPAQPAEPVREEAKSEPKPEQKAEAKPEPSVPPLSSGADPMSQFKALSPLEQAHVLHRKMKEVDPKRFAAYTVDRMEKWKPDALVRCFAELLKKESEKEVPA